MIDAHAPFEAQVDAAKSILDSLATRLHDAEIEVARDGVRMRADETAEGHGRRSLENQAEAKLKAAKAAYKAGDDAKGDKLWAEGVSLERQAMAPRWDGDVDRDGK